MSENILVTGGAGYIGSHACKKLRSRGFPPKLTDAELITMEIIGYL